jgi:quercetin dioxygenase-like cupin family protein
MTFDSVSAHRAFRTEKLSKNAVFAESGVAMVDVYCARPGQGQPVHGHANAAKSYLILEGRARVTVGELVRDLCPGDLAFAPRGVPHGLTALGSEDLVAVVFIAGAL